MSAEKGAAPRRFFFCWSCSSALPLLLVATMMMMMSRGAAFILHHHHHHRSAASAITSTITHPASLFTSSLSSLGGGGGSAIRTRRRARGGGAGWRQQQQQAGVVVSMSSSSSSSAGATVAAPKVLVAVADGTEEIEAVTTIDTLVRAGASVTVASVMPNLQVTCSRGVLLVANRGVSDCAQEDWDLVAIPGGLPGAEYLRDSQALTEILKKQQAAGRWVAAICAAPALVLQTHGLLEGRKATCYPVDKFTGMLKQYESGKPVVVDKQVVTSQGPGSSALFALKLVEVLFDRDKAAEVAAGMLVNIDAI